MAYGTPADPVGGTVITVAYAVANILDPIRWLRLLTGNADPPGSSYVVVSTSTTGTSWQKVPADALAAGVAVANLGYTPINKAGDTGIGSLTSAGTIQAAALVSTGNASVTGTMTAGTFNGGTTGAGGVSAAGFAAGSSGFAGGPHSGTTGSFSGNLGSAGTVSAAIFNGGTTASGGVSAAGFAAGASGVAGGPHSGTTAAFSGNGSVGGTLTVGAITGGSTSVGGLSVLGLAAGASGVDSVGPVTVGGNPVYHAGNPPPLSGGGAAVPTGLVAMFRTDAERATATGWSRETNLNGRIPVGAGTTFSTTFVEDTAYGSAWSFTSTDSGHTHPLAAAGISGSTGQGGSVNGKATAGGVNLNEPTHTHDQGTLDVTGNADSASATMTATTWTIPSRAYVYARFT